MLLTMGEGEICLLAHHHTSQICPPGISSSTTLRLGREEVAGFGCSEQRTVGSGDGGVVTSEELHEARLVFADDRIW